jgi:tellurite methyltransferase
VDDPYFECDKTITNQLRSTLHMQNQLQQTFGNIDIYLFDQLLKGRCDNCKKVLDAGCGSGRNLFYFLRNGYEVFGVDPNAQAVEMVKELSAVLAPDNPLANFIVCPAENLPSL